MKHKSGSLQEHAAVVISSSADDEKRIGEDELSERKRRKKKQRRESASPQELVAHVSVSPGGLTQSQKKPKKKRRPDDEAEEEEEEVTLLPTAEPMQHQDKKKKKKKRSGEEPPAVIDVDTPKKKFKDMKEEEICLPSPNGLTHCQKKKKRVKKKKEEVMAIATVSPTPEKAPKKKKKKKSGETVINKEKKKKRKAADVTSSQEEDVDWVLVAELQGYLPHIKMKCVNQIKKMLVCDLHRFRRFKLQGVPARLGRFSEQENQKIRENVADFMALTGISTAEKLLFPQRFQDEQDIIRKLKKQHGFMEKLAEGIPRPCQQVYLRALKMFDPKHHMGRFSEEELASLVKLHKLHGNNWKLISEKMDRSIYSLQKRFSTIAADHGPWCGEEEKRLKQAVKEYLQTLVGDGSPGLSKDQLSKRLPWQEISQKLETRSWIQCRIKWQSLLEGRLTWYGKVFTRGADGYDAKIRLIKTLYNTCVEDIADVNWEEIAQAVGKVTAWSVQRMFSRLKQRKVPHAHTLSFGETIDFLYHQVVPVLKKKLKAYGSWATHQTQQGPDRYQLSDIFYSDMEDEEDEEANS
ncbi:transcription termination factor 1 [Fundulus heteroclitus]|uniref:transcription termination factor 1 n=1 Tax=Fundulus heteroclitus TaxID=8078 RepID=UPI00165C40A7|nr:transcription termination factor 1 [Fundulus heteroclitus]XP_036000125.1 transcription termination factor 1 [Fundulus heteroclitus]